MPLYKTCPSCHRRNPALNAACEFCDTTLESIQAFEAPSLVVPRLSINRQSLFVPRQFELVIGRADRASGWAPDIDLLPFGGTAAAGVSRRHARLVWDEKWFIQDMNSANGTVVNHTPLPPGQTMELANSSIIQIGTLFVVFQM